MKHVVGNWIMEQSLTWDSYVLLKTGRNEYIIE